MVVGTDTLIREVAPELVAFLKEGDKVDLTSFFAKARPELAIENLDRLLRIHFVLTEATAPGAVGVIDFIRGLPERLHRIKTMTRARTGLYEGEVRGRVQWGPTLLERYRCAGSGPQVFVCDEIERDYDIPENRVLKEIVGIIAEIVIRDLARPFADNRPWLGPWLTEPRLREELLFANTKNVYLRRIDRSPHGVTDAMIVRTTRSRIPLYRDAAGLLARYRRLKSLDIDTAEAADLLMTTFIRPNRPDVLFELYWIAKLIRQFKSTASDFRLLPLETGNRCVAIWSTNGMRFALYHNSQADFTFLERASDARRALSDRDSYLGRSLLADEGYRRLFGKDVDRLWNGRPDIMLVATDKAGRRRFALIGEVKYTASIDYAKLGLRELLLYMALVKDDGSYFEPYDALFNRPRRVHGCLFTDAADLGRLSEDIGVTHVFYGYPNCLAFLADMNV